MRNLHVVGYVARSDADAVSDPDLFVDLKLGHGLTDLRIQVADLKRELRIWVDLVTKAG